MARGSRSEPRTARRGWWISPELFVEAREISLLHRRLLAAVGENRIASVAIKFPEQGFDVEAHRLDDQLPTVPHGNRHFPALDAVEAWNPQKLPSKDGENSGFARGTLLLPIRYGRHPSSERLQEFQITYCRSGG